MIMAKNSPIIFNFKHKFINHGYSTLKTLYERKKERYNYVLTHRLENQNNQIPSDPETKELVQSASKASFSLIEIIVQSVFDLNEVE